MLRDLKRSSKSFLTVIVIGLAVNSCVPNKQVVTPEIPVPTEAQVYEKAPGCKGPILDFALAFPSEGSCDEACLEKIGDLGEKALKCAQDDSAYFEALYMILRAKVEAINAK